MSERPSRGEIHLGDLALALASLNWEGDEQAATIAASLGFGLRPAPSPEPPEEIYDRQRYRRHETTPASTQPPPVYVPPAPEPPPELPIDTLESRLTSLPERVPAAPGEAEWLEEACDEPFPDEEDPPLVRQPLFSERTNRHILSTALTTPRPGAEIDMPRLISAVCRRAVISKMPCRPEQTLESGCHLLLDYSQTMVPFWDDLGTLARQVADVVGEDATQVYSFDTRPDTAVRWTSDGKRESWRADGRPVLVATDFGIQGRRERTQTHPGWSQLVHDCEKESSTLIALVPWPEDRWPQDIGPYPTLVHWSPHTTAGMVSKRHGRGRHAAR